LIRVIAVNELRRRIRDRSMVITCIVAPLVLAGILGFAFGGGSAGGTVRIGVTGATPTLISAAERAVQPPHTVVIVPVRQARVLKREVADGTLGGGVILTGHHTSLPDLLIPIVAPGATHSPGFEVVDRADALIGQEWSESLAAALASRLYAGHVQAGSTADLATISLTIGSHDLGNGGRTVLNYFAPSIAVIFLFIGSGLGMRSLMLERAAGTLVRMAAAPVRPLSIVLGKMLAILITGLTSIFVVWGVTTFVFGADWGDPLGVFVMCVGASLAMCGLGVFLTSLARNEREAFGVALIVGLFLSLLGGNLLPPGSLPQFLQVLSLGTPNGWSLVGFGRLSLLGDPARSVVGPFLALCAIAAVTAGLAWPRVRRMVRP
jgi:ABC-2 type transport system permease protein